MILARAAQAARTAPAARLATRAAAADVAGGGNRVVPHTLGGQRALSSWFWDKTKAKREAAQKEKEKEQGKEATADKPAVEETTLDAKAGDAQAAAKPGESSSTAKPSGSNETSTAAAGFGNSASPPEAANLIASVLTLQGAPRQSTVLALPLDRRPLFPGVLHPLQITDRAVYEALVRTRASGNPYIGVFLRKHDVKARDFIEQAPSDRILSMDEIHSTGMFAQIVQMEPLQGLLSHDALDDHEDHDDHNHSDHEDGEIVEYQNADEQQQKDDLRRALFKDGKRVSSSGGGAGGASQSGGSGGASLDSTNKLVANARDESWTLVVKAHRRIKIEDMLAPGPPPLVKVQHVSELPLSSYDSDTIRAYTNEVLATLRDVIRHNPLLREHMQLFSTRFDMSDPHHVCNFAAALTSADGQDLQEVLEALNLETRLKKVLTLLKKEVQLNSLQQEISKQVEETISANQRKYFLNEQLKQIKKELGLEHDDKDALLEKYRTRFENLQKVTTLEEARRATAKERKAAEDSTNAAEGGGTAGADGASQSNGTTHSKAVKKERIFTQNGIPDEAKRVIEEEMKKLSTLEKTSPEFNVSRGYLDWLLSLPWTRSSLDNLDIKHAKAILEADHFGLSDIKQRILEFIAVGNLRGTVQGKIILLVGPPGVGKTSIGKSIAHALDRDFYRFSVGGLSDVSEIKGHRRTYIGAMPGKLVQCLKSTGVSNPVVLIDEIDKLGSGYRGDPASALLELLDPAQNASFLDHYLDVPIDLSKVLFVCTANSLDTIPGPLLDRMEVLRLAGYDLPEKVQIARRYLEPRSKRDCGLVEVGAVDLVHDALHPAGLPEVREPHTKIDVPDSLGLDEEAIASLARWYCRESGVRKLEQEIEKIYRKLTLELLEATEEERRERNWLVTADKLEKYVGKPRYQSDKLYGSVPPAGVVMGLAWSTNGGSSLYIETTAIRRAVLQKVAPRDGAQAGTGADAAAGADAKAPQPFAAQAFSVHTTGQLGDVMKESTSIALTFAKAMLQDLSPGNAFFESNQIHLHVPEGATPKDGPSAGVTITTALLSLALGRSVIADLAMTGEISLTGMVLPIGGVKEKIIAARRSGVTTVVLPDGNRKDVDELPAYLRDGLNIHFAKHYTDVYAVAFKQE